MNFIVGKKLNMSQHFIDSGEVIPVTVLKVPAMTVVQIKSVNGKDKYNAVQVGVSPTVSGSRKSNKPLSGHLKDLGTLGTLTEFRLDDVSGYERGQKIDLNGFQVGELVNCIATMKGRGFAGAIKRHGFAGFPASHGHDRPRSVGSIGQRFPQHTRKGLRMSGHMGNSSSTVKNLQVVDIDIARGLIFLKGAVPGSNGGMVKVVSTGQVKPLVPKLIEKNDKKK